MFRIALLLLISLDSLGAVILQYHHVAEDTPPITSITPTDFAAHMDYLQSASFNVIGLPELVDALRSDRVLPDKTVAITFDDAYQNILINAVPVLVRHGFPYAVFVATDQVGSSSAFLTWDQLRHMQQGGATIANHTASHPHLLRQDESEDEASWLARVASEITRAAEAIDSQLAPAPRFFAYPYGEYDGRIIEIVERLGYIGFGQQSGAAGPSSDLRLLPRFPFAGRYSGLEDFKVKVATKPMPLVRNTISPLVSDTDPLPILTLTFQMAETPYSTPTCYGPNGDLLDIEIHAPHFYLVKPQSPVPVGRSRYNCTMPAGDGRFYWFSQMWIRRNPDGSWYPEP